MTGACSGSFLLAAAVVVVPFGSSLSDRIGGDGFAGGADVLGVEEAGFELEEAVERGWLATGGGGNVFPKLVLVVASPGFPC